MKKSELTQLTQLIEVLVTRELRKQLPKLIGEVFQNMAGKSIVSENIQPARKDYIAKEVDTPTIPKDTNEFRSSLKELFSNSTPVTRSDLEEGLHSEQPRAMKQYTKDPILNKVLNETVPDLKSRERMTGLAAFQGGYNPGMPPAAAVVGAGEMMPQSELPSFSKGQLTPSQQSPSVIQENHIPAGSIPEGISALDVAKAGIIPPLVTEALTKYDRMRKILEASKGRR
jgi:hypothetical protein